MPQNDMVIANQSFPAFRSDLNSALQAQAGNQKGSSAPSTAYAGQFWVDDNTPSATVWTVFQYDGSDWIPLYYLDAATNRRAALGPFVPGGRLTLTSGAPVMSADASAATTVYYALHLHDKVPIYDGTHFVETAFAELSLALDGNSGHTGYHQSGKNFDLFVVTDAGTVRLGTGPAWSSDAARGTGAGTTELERKNGVWTNKVAVTLRFGSASGNTVSVPANHATYVGTTRATADGQTGMAFKPAAAGGGSANVLGLYNAYHRVPVRSLCRDSTSSWTHASTTWRGLNNSGSNRVSFVDGLQQSAIDASVQAGAYTSATSNAAAIGVNLDATTGAPNVYAPTTFATNVTLVTSRETFAPQLGFHYVQAMEAALVGGTATFAGNLPAATALVVSLEM